MGMALVGDFWPPFFPIYEILTVLGCFLIREIVAGTSEWEQAGGLSAQPSETMSDLIYVCLILGFFVASGAYLHFCDHL